jgi:hypothetical protein
MRSPKFPVRADSLKKTIDQFELKAVWKRHVRDFLRREAVSDALEYLDFHIRIDREAEAIAARVLGGEYVTSPPARLLAEKSKGLCRQLVIPSPSDSVLLQALSEAIWKRVRTEAPSKNSFYAPNDHAFSKPNRGLTNEYGPVATWIKFQQKILGFAKTREFVVVTDVANYYDFIAHNHLRNILSDHAKQTEHELDLIIYILSSLSWQPDYMPRIDIGLPQTNLDAPRLLAHCFLFEIDRFLLAQGCDFARFMDDIDIGIDTLPEAKRIIRDLDRSLQTRQVRLNSGKTKILSRSEAFEHFRIRENAVLDDIEDSLDLSVSQGRDITGKVRFLSKILDSRLLKGQFSAGNGEKILKRMVNYISKFKGDIYESTFREILFKWPSVRKTALRWWVNSNNPSKFMHVIRDLIQSGEIVDDLTYIEIAGSLVSSRIEFNIKNCMMLDDVIGLLDVKHSWQLHSAILISSKYSEKNVFAKLLLSTATLWQKNIFTVRLVCASAARCFGMSQYNTIYNTIMRDIPAVARGPWEFVAELEANPNKVRQIAKFLRANNPTEPAGISHGKFLLLLSALRNAALTKQEVHQLVRGHFAVRNDPFYMRLARGY